METKLEQIVEILHNQAVDGEFTRFDRVENWLKDLTETEKEIIMACYWIGFNDRFEGDEE